MRDVKLVDGINDAIRDNPLAAALVGAGVFWMLFGSKVPGQVSAVPGAARAAGQTGRNFINAASDSVSGVSSRVGSTLESADATVRDAASRVIPDADSFAAANETVSQSWNDGVRTTQRFATTAQQQLAEAMERQPLVLGALGLAIGAGMASAFAATQVENRLVGQHGAAARESIANLAGEAKDFAAERGRQVLDDVKQEAEAQGLTPEHAKEAFGEAVSKVKNVAGAARESATGGVSQSQLQRTATRQDAV